MRTTITLVRLAGLFAYCACNPEPIVVLGRAPRSLDAGMMDATVGRGGSSGGETHECTEFEPVCGDDKTYLNRCQALDAGAQVIRPGAC